MDKTRDIIQEVGKWAELNFDVMNPWLGMVEEIGETAHCFLKREQKIRAYENPAFFTEQLTDAVGDFGIYAAHYAYLHNLDLRFDLHSGELPYQVATINVDWVISDILGDLSLLYHSTGEDQQNLFNYTVTAVSHLAATEAVRLEDVTFITWDMVVSKRDWKKDPITGG